MQNVLPDMDEPRLKTLGKQLNRNRKTSLIHHGQIKGSFETLEKSLNKEQRHVDGKFFRMGIKLKKNLAQVRGTQKCLKIKREQSFWEDTDEYPYGVYEGERLASYRREIENIIEEKHPRIRRMRRVDQYLKDGKTNGRLIAYEEAKSQFDSIMNKRAVGDSPDSCRNANTPIYRSSFHRLHKSYVYSSTSPFSESRTSPKMQSKLNHLSSDYMQPSSPSGGLKPESPLITTKSNSLLPLSNVEVTGGVKSTRYMQTKLTLPPIMADKRAVDSRRTERGHHTPDVLNSTFTDMRHIKTPVKSKRSQAAAIRRMSKFETPTSKEVLQDLDRLKNRRATSYVK